jgi:hypothetical protein
MLSVPSAKSEIADSIERSYQSAERLDQIVSAAISKMVRQVVDDQLEKLNHGKQPCAAFYTIFKRPPEPAAPVDEDILRQQALTYYQQACENLKNSHLSVQVHALEKLLPHNHDVKQLAAVVHFIGKLTDDIAGFEKLLQDESLYKDDQDLRYAQTVAYTIEKTTRSFVMATPAILAGDAGLLKAELEKAQDFQRRCQQPTVTRKYLIKGAVLIADTFIGTVIAIGCVTLCGCSLTPMGACGAGLLIAYGINRVLMHFYIKLKDKINKKITPKNTACKALEQQAEVMQTSLIQANAAIGSAQQVAKALKLDKVLDPEYKRIELLASLKRTQRTIDELMYQDSCETTVNFFRVMQANVKSLATRVNTLPVESVDNLVYARLLKELTALETSTYVVANHLEGIEQGDQESIDVALAAAKEYKLECLSHYSTVKSGANWLASELILFANANVRLVVSKLVGTLGIGVFFGAKYLGATIGKRCELTSFRAFSFFIGEFPGYWVSKGVRKLLTNYGLNTVMRSSFFDPSAIKQDNQRVRGFYEETHAALQEIQHQAVLPPIDLAKPQPGYSIQK